jgi:capsular exopolysaccharide synthesis family protein
MNTTEREHPHPAFDEVSLSEIVDIVVRRRRILLWTMLLALVVGVSLALMPRRYEANGSIRVQPGLGAMYRTSPLSLLAGEASDKIASEVAIVQSRGVYLRVAEELDLANSPAFWDKPSLTAKLSLNDGKVRQNVLQRMHDKVQIGHNPKDEIITIQCTTISPVLSAKIVDSIINTYVEQIFAMRYGASQRASGWLIKQLDDLKKQIEENQSSLIELQNRLGILGLNEKDSDLLSADTLATYSKAATNATIERIVAEAKLRRLQESDPNLIEGEVNLLSNANQALSPNSLLQNLRNSQAQASSRYAKLLEQFGPNYPDVMQVRAELDEIDRQVGAEQKRIVNQAQMSYTTASANERMTQQALLAEKGKTANSSSDTVKYIILLHDYQSHRSLYEGLVLRLREAGITSGMEAGDVDIVDLADVPAIPAPPGRVLYLGASLVSGFVLGLLAAFVVEALQTRIGTVDQAERVTRLSLLSILPHRKSGKSDDPVVGAFRDIAPQSSRYSEGVEALRTSILYSGAGSGSKVISITSALPAEGKSTVSMNLAAVFAQHHERVVLIDCDLRKGSLASKLGIPLKKGLSGVLIGIDSLEDCIAPVPGIDGLFLLAGGVRPPNPAVLLDGPSMQKVVDLCKRQFDYIVLDCPPVLGISDAIHIGRLADTTVVIVRSGYSRKKALNQVLHLMRVAQIRLLGFVFNDEESIGSAYGYSYGYGYHGYFDDNGEVSSET